MASKKGYWRSYGNHGKGICCAVLYGQYGCCTVTNGYTTRAFRAGGDRSLNQEPPIAPQRHPVGARLALLPNTGRARFPRIEQR